jgi:hypothetical protein
MDSPCGLHTKTRTSYIAWIRLNVASASGTCGHQDCILQCAPIGQPAHCRVPGGEPRWRPHCYGECVPCHYVSLSDAQHWLASKPLAYEFGWVDLHPRSKAAQQPAAALEGHQHLRLTRLACGKGRVPGPPECARMGRPLPEPPGSWPSQARGAARCSAMLRDPRGALREARGRSAAAGCSTNVQAVYPAKAPVSHCLTVTIC